MTRTYPNLSRVEDPETRETIRIVYDLIYTTREEGDIARADLLAAREALDTLVPEVEDLQAPSLFAAAGGLGPGHYVAADVLDQQVLVVSSKSPSRVLFRQLVLDDLDDVFHETSYANGDFLIYDKAKEQWRGKAVAGVIDHGGLLGLGDDDHPHYALADKSRPSPWVAAGDLAGLSIGDLGTKDHDLLDGLGDDDHTIYALLAGRAGGQTLYGGTASGEDLYLYSTAHATKGTVFLGDIGGITVGGNLNMNWKDILAVDDIVGNGGSKFSGGSGAGESLILESTTHATKAKIYLGSSLNDYYDEAIEELYINTAKAAGIGAEVGDAFIGTHAGGSNVAIFCNEALKAVANAQALSVSAAGGITMQCAVGQGFNIQSGVNVILQLGTPEIGVWKAFSMNSNDILGVDDIVGNSGSRFSGGSVAGTYLILSSTTHATKGYIWFGSAASMVFNETDGGIRLKLKDSDTCLLQVETTAAHKAAHLTLLNSNVANNQQWDVLNDGSASDVFAIKDNTGMTTPFVIGKAAPTNSFVMLPSGYVGLGIAVPTARLDVYLNASAVWACNIFNDQASAGHGLRVETDGTGAGTTAFLVNCGAGDAFKIFGGRNSWFGGDVDMGGNDITNVDEILGNGAMVIYGGAGAGNDLLLQSTQHATKGDVTVDGELPLWGRNYRCRLLHNTNQSIPNTTWTVLSFNSENFDPAGMHSVVSNITRITPGVVGTYMVGGTVQWSPSGAAGQWRRMGIMLNGTTWLTAQDVEADTSRGHQMNVSTLWLTVNATDYFELMVYQNSGGALNVMNTNYLSPVFWCFRIE